jgi:PAS domain S-box-containing protein
VRNALSAGGQVGRDLADVDWSQTSVGPPEDWPNSLRTAVRIVLSSKFSMWMAWGPELVFFCNDSYRRDTLGKKYPWALGRPAAEVWSEIWPDIGPRIQKVMSTGEATWDENLQLFLERSGYVEESYHTFSYSPLADDEGQTAGMLCVVTEDTEQVISVQRMTTLRDLGTHVAGDLTEAEAVAATCEQLAANPQALPFCLVYLFTGDGTRLVRSGMTGFTGEHPAAPGSFDVDDPDAAWPGLKGEDRVFDDLSLRFADLPTGAWDDPPTQALAVPLVQPTVDSPYGYLVVGLNRHRPFDNPYHDFISLIAGHLSAALTSARSYEFERQRAETLARIDQSKTDFFTNVSHEFRTPLTLLLGPAEDALADASAPLAPAQRERLDVIRRNGQRLLKLVNSLLDFSRLEAEKATSHFEPVDLPAYTAELVGMFSDAARRAGLALVIECPPLPRPIVVDREHWAKIVLNLVSNAVKFTFDGTISVSTRVEGEDVVLEVADTGEGISEDEVPHLFERFHRIRGSRSRTHEGSGIGLALVSELTRLHGGTATASSAVGRGTTFTIRVPLEGRHPTAHPGTSAGAGQIASSFLAEASRWLEQDRPGPKVAASPEQRRATILVVDDNVDMRDYIASLLRDEYEVATATDGIDALEQLPLVRPDIVLTDVMMPRLDGFGLIARIQADPLTTSLPVIMISARGGEDGTVEGLDAGAADYLSKPFSARELLARVRVNLELDRTTRVRSTLERSEALLDQAQRLASVGSFEVDFQLDTLAASDELLRLFGRTREDFESFGYARALSELIHPDDHDIVQEAVEGVADGCLTAYEARVILPSGEERLLSVRAEAAADETGKLRYVRGSAQDVTQQRAAEQALVAAAARDEAAAREHSIADELQRSLLPARTFDLDHLDAATYYRAGVAGTQVGGDWYDIIKLSRGRTALVIGDVMGRGVSAAAVMGQMRSAVRALATLALPPTEVMQHLDTMVQDLPGDQIVTCVYGVFDPADHVLRYANAGHLPPLLRSPLGPVERLTAGGPPLGAGYLRIPTEIVHMRPGSSITFYTDGLVERRGDDIDRGIDSLATALAGFQRHDLQTVPERLVETLLPDGPDDDVAILIARVGDHPLEAVVSYSGIEQPVIASARRHVVDHLRSWGVPPEPTDDMALMTSELFTNAVRHGDVPVELSIALVGGEIVLEVHDRGVDEPTPVEADDQDEHGRGLHIVSVLATRWGRRWTEKGKTVWCVLALDPTTYASPSPEEHSWT